MPKIVEEEIETPGAPEPEEDLGSEYDDEEELDAEVSKSAFGQVPREGRAWMANIKRISNILEDTKNTITRMKKAQQELPTSHDLMANDRLNDRTIIYEMERRWQAALGVIQQIESSLEALRQEKDTLDRELRTIKQNKAARR